MATIQNLIRAQNPYNKTFENLLLQNMQQPQNNLPTQDKLTWQDIYSQRPTITTSQEPYKGPPKPYNIADIASYWKKGETGKKPSTFQALLKSLGTFLNTKEGMNLIGLGTLMTGGSPYMAQAFSRQGEQITAQNQAQQAAYDKYIQGLRDTATKYDLKAMGLVDKGINLGGLRDLKVPEGFEIYRYDALGRPLLKKKDKTSDKVYMIDEKGITELGEVPKGAITYKAPTKPETLAKATAAKTKAKLKAEKGRKILPANEAVELGDTQTSIEILDNLSRNIPNIKGLTFTPFDKVKALNPFDTGAQQMNQLIATTKQIIGKGLEGGVLRAEDEVKYEKIIPKLGDTQPVLNAKMEQLRDILIKRYDNKKASYENAGYDVSNFTAGFSEFEPIGQSKIKYSQEDLEYTAQKYGLTVKRVKQILGVDLEPKSKRTYTQADLEYTAEKYGLTVEKIKEILEIAFEPIVKRTRTYTQKELEYAARDAGLTVEKVKEILGVE